MKMLVHYASFTGPNFLAPTLHPEMTDCGTQTVAYIVDRQAEHVDIAMMNENRLTCRPANSRLAARYLTVTSSSF